MKIREYRQTTKARHVTLCVPVRINVVTCHVLLSLLVYFNVYTANAQRQQEQIVFVSEGEELDQIQLATGAGGQVKKLTIQQQSFYAATPSLSFDGERVAYVWQMARGGQWHYDIYIMDIRSGEQHQVTFEPSADLHPSWAPDGSRIVFSSDKDGDFDLYTVDENGENRTRMTNSWGDDVQPDWSPDGRKIAFASDQESLVHQIFWMDVKTRHQEKLTQSNYHSRYPRWSPDGTRVAYRSAVVDVVIPTGNWQIFQVRADGTDLKSLIMDGDYNSTPVFSPDGKQIAFSSVRDDNSDIYTFDRISLQTVRLTRNPSIDKGPSWSPDGKHLAFSSKRTGNYDIHTMNTDGGEIVNLTQSGTAELMPAWSPRGDMISFVRVVDGVQEIHVMDDNGNRQMRLDNSPFLNTSPTWSPHGETIAFVNKPRQDAKVWRIYTIDADGQNKRLIFETIDGVIKNISWSSDGNKMLFVYWIELGQDQGVLELRTLDMNTREVNSIDIDPDFKSIGLNNAVWAPNGRTIVFSALPVNPQRTFRYGIFLVNADGNSISEHIRDTFDPQEIAYGKGRISWSSDGQSILFSRGTGNLYVTGLHGGGVRLFIRNAHSPDWKTPRIWQNVTPKNKLQTTWGEIKEIIRN